MGKRIVVRRGERFGALVATGRNRTHLKYSQAQLRCRCGKLCWKLNFSLRRGAIKSCSLLCPFYRGMRETVKGDRFWHLVATGQSKFCKRPDGRRERFIQVKCQCDSKPFWERLSRLKTGHTRSCSRSCAFNPNRLPLKRGLTFGTLITTGKSKIQGHSGRTGATYSQVKCKCGSKPFWIRASNLRYGTAKTCGPLCPFNPRRLPGNEASIRSAYGVYCRGCSFAGRDFQPLPMPLWKRVVEQPCMYCGTPPAPRLPSNERRGRSHEPFFCSSLDHFDPTVKTPCGNSVPCCLSCNMEKLDMTPREWKDRLIRTRGKAKTLKICYRVEAYLREQRKWKAKTIRKLSA